MKTFVYRGFDREGNRRKGAVEALDLKDAREKLTRTGILPEQVEPAAGGGLHRKSFRGTPSVALKNSGERAELYRALAALLRAGLPLAHALEVMLDQPGGGKADLLRDIAGVRDRIRDGAAFALALREAGAELSGFEDAVIESGERTGRLADVLGEVADYLDDAGRILATLKNAALYPAVIMGLSMVVGIGVLGFLVPKLASVFEDANMPLPLVTRVVVGIGAWFLPVILPVVAGLSIAAVVAVRRVLGREDLRARVEQRLMRIRGVGYGMTLLVSARFARTCALLLGGGLSMVEAVALGGRATGSVWLAGLLQEKSEAIRHGESLSHALAGVPVLRETLSSWVKAGETAGDIPGMFNHAAGRYQLLWTQYIQRAVTLIEPALIILVALFVLVVALAILLPILSLSQLAG